MLDEPTPVQASSPHCAVGVRRPTGQWTSCPGEVTHAAVWVERHTRQRWRAFLCGSHADHPGMSQTRPLTGADREALAIRRRNRAAALAGQPWTPPKPLPPGWALR